MGRIIGILSGKGGVGKTTLAANLGTVLSHEYNKKVLLVDGNVTAPNLDLHFGLYDEFPFTLREALNGRVSISQSINVCSKTGVKIIQSPLSKGSINLKKFKELIKKLERTHDIIIVDFAPALGKEVLSVMDAIEETIVVTTPLIPEVASALKTINFLNEQKKIVLGLVINRVKNKGYELKTDEIESVCKLPILSIIQEDPKVPHSISEGIPIVLFDKYSNISNQFRKLAANIIGEEYIEHGILERIRNLFISKKITPNFIQTEL